MKFLHSSGGGFDGWLKFLDLQISKFSNRIAHLLVIAPTNTSDSAMSGDTKLIFQGVKFYWKTRNTLDVTIADHVDCNTTEIVLYDPSLGIEAPRIYLSSSALFAKLDHDEIEYQLSFAKRNCLPITEKFIDGIVNKAKSEYMLKRLVIVEYSVEAKIVVVEFQGKGISSDSSDPLCEKPASCVPYQAVHYQQLMVGAVDLAIRALNSEKAKLHTECDKAVELEKIAEDSTKKLSAKERWRIPIVFIKISNSKRLSAADARILSSVAQNLHTEEDATRMSAVLLSRARSHRGSGILISPTAATSRDVTLFGSQHAVTPAPTPRQRGASQSKLHQTTAAARYRAEATHGAGHATGPGAYSRQSSFRMGESGVHAGAEGHGPSATLKAPSKEEAGEVSYNKRNGGGKTPRSPKRPVSRNNSSSKSARKPLLSRLRTSVLGTAQASDVADGASGTTTGTEEGQSALQNMITSLETLRTSFLVALSSKSGNTGNSGNSTKTGGVGESGAGAYAAPSTTENSPVDGVAIAIQQAAAGAALVIPASGPLSHVVSKRVDAPQGDVKVTAQAQAQGRSLSAHMESGAKSGTASASAVAADTASVTTTDSAADAGAASEFTIQRFFAGLVRWHGSNKIYAAA